MTNSALLPSNSVPLERALVDSANTGADLPPVVRDTLVPERIGRQLLPWMAYGFSVDEWNEDWPDEVKRNVIRTSFRFHQLKGTMAGLRWAARLAGSEIVRAINPPAKMFAAPTMTEEERRAFLARYPELRILPFRGRGHRPALPGDRRWIGFYGRRDFVGAGLYPFQSDAAARLAPRAQLEDAGVVVPLTTVVRDWDWRDTSPRQEVEVHRHGFFRHGAFVGGLIRFPSDLGARQRIYTIVTSSTLNVPGSDKLALRTVVPSLDPITIYADDVRQHGIRRGIFAGAFYPGCGFGRSMSQSTTARDRIYKRLYLFDPNRTIESRGRSTHLGVTRLGMPPFWSELTVKCRSRQGYRRFGRYVGVGYPVASDHAKLAKTLRLLRVSRRGTTKVLINTKTVDVITAGVAHAAGTVVAGELQEIV